MNPELKDLVKGISDLGTLVSDFSQGFQFKEISELVALSQDGKTVVNEAPQMLAKYEALDDAGRVDLMAYIDTLSDFPVNMKVDEVIRKVLKCGVYLSGLLHLVQS